MDELMTSAEVITRNEFLSDRHGKTFADVLNDSDARFDEVLEFFNDATRQQRMDDESLPAVRDFLATLHRRRSARLRQAIGVLVRMIMERRGWRRTGKKGSLGVRGTPNSRTPYHNTGGLAFWFIRAERYRREAGMPYRSVRERCEEFGVADLAESTAVETTKEVAPKTSRDGSSA
jgi:hypothetical protein